MTVRLELVAAGLTGGARRGVIGVNESLDAQGSSQASAMAGRWPEGMAARTSPARQSVETARLLGLSAQADEDLRDWDLGSWSGRSLDELGHETPADLSAWRGDPGFDGHGGETLVSLIGRAGAWLARIEEGEHGRLVGVTHTSVIRAAIVAALDLPAAAFWRLDVEPLASAHLTLGGGRTALRWAADRER